MFTKILTVTAPATCAILRIATTTATGAGI
jgi:hypothetical protein